MCVISSIVPCFTNNTTMRKSNYILKDRFGCRYLVSPLLDAVHHLGRNDVIAAELMKCCNSAKKLIRKARKRFTYCHYAFSKK